MKTTSIYLRLLSFAFLIFTISISPLNRLFSPEKQVVAYNFPDSTQYLELTAEMMNIDPAQFSQSAHFLGPILRPPLFPFLLATSMSIGGVQPHSILWLHASIMLIIVVINSYLLRHFIPITWSLAVQILAIDLLRDFFIYIGPEFLTGCLLLVLMINIALWFRKFDWPFLFGAFCTVILLSLTRNEFIWFFVCLPLFFIFFERKRIIFKVLFSIIAFLCFYSTNKILAPNQAFGLLGALSASISTNNLPVVLSSNSEDCFEEKMVNILKVQDKQYDCFADVLDIKHACNLNWSQISSSLYSLSIKRILQSPFMFLTEVIKRCWPLQFSLPILILALFLRFRTKLEPILTGLNLICAIFFNVHILLISFVNIMDLRYYLPALVVLTFGLCINLIAAFPLIVFKLKRQSECL